MFSRTKPFLIHSNFQYVIRWCQNQSTKLENFLISVKESPPTPCYSRIFFDPTVQELLKKVTNTDIEKVFKFRPLGKKVRAPVYKLLTTEELEKERKEALKKAEYLLQIPPLVSVTEDQTEILDDDTSLDGYDEHHSKHVFVDISPNSTDVNRVVVVREANGVLRTGSKNERHRMNQIFFPVPEKKLKVPKMFEIENLKNVILRKDYEFILDRACLQFEPDEAMYHEVITLTYEAINYLKDFNLLLSTRHFGSLVFYLVTHKKIDNLLECNLNSDRLDDAFSLVKLYHILHPKCKSNSSLEGKDDIEILQNFISLESQSPDVLNRALQALLNREKSKKEQEDELKKAHGL